MDAFEGMDVYAPFVRVAGLFARLPSLASLIWPEWPDFVTATQDLSDAGDDDVAIVRPSQRDELAAHSQRVAIGCSSLRQRSCPPPSSQDLVRPTRALNRSRAA